MANLIKKIDNQVRRIPDFYEPEDNLGRRDCMKGLSSLTGGVISLMTCMVMNNEKAFDVGLCLAATGAILYFGYSAKGICKTIKSENDYYKLKRII